MAFSPQQFVSNINAKGGLAKPNRFEVILPIPTYINSFVTNSVLDKLIATKQSFFQDISQTLTGMVGTVLGQDPMSAQDFTSNPAISRYLAAQCEMAELPGKTLNTHKAQIYGPGYQVPFRAEYRDINLTFFCTNDFSERKLFDRWMEAIHPSDTNNLRFPKGQKTRYMTNIKIIQYDEFIKQIYAVELLDAYPIGVAPQALSWSEDGFHRLQVQFAYQKYRTIYDGNYDIGAAASALFGSAASRLLPFGTAVTKLPF